MQERVTKQAKDAQDKLNELLGSLDGDLKKLREQAQDLAMQSVGRAAEYAVKARETYDELAERGRGAVQTWRGDAADQVEELAVAIEPEPASKGRRQGRAQEPGGGRQRQRFLPRDGDQGPGRERDQGGGQGHPHDAGQAGRRVREEAHPAAQADRAGEEAHPADGEVPPAVTR